MIQVYVKLHHVQCLDARGLHRMAYWEWKRAASKTGESKSADKVLVCVHGLTRQGRDFDVLAQSLATEYDRIVCPDIVGRGESDWLNNPKGYQLATYLADMVTLLARLNTSSIDWVGTSMGGLIGILLAGLPNNPIRRLVLNDVGPTLNATALKRIGAYVGQKMHWLDETSAITYLAQLAPGFGPHSTEQWRALNQPMLRPVSDGSPGLRLHYDPAIAEVFVDLNEQTAKSTEQWLWHTYDQIRCPTLVLRGALSDLLTADTAHAMTQRGPAATCVEIPGVGHAPTLIQDDQLQVVRSFLMAHHQ